MRGQGFSRNRIFDPNKNLIDKYSLFVAGLPDIYLSYSDDITKQLVKHGCRSKVLTAVNTLNTDILDEHIDEFQNKSKEERKEDLGLKKKKYIVYIGRLQERKKVKILLEHYSKLRNAGINDYGLIIIGDGELLNELKKITSERNIPDVTFTGQLALDDLRTSYYLMCSDILYIPGWLGLAVNHGMYLGLPVIGTTPNGFLGHGPEVEFLKHGYNSYLLENYMFEEFYKAFTEIDLKIDSYRKNALNYSHNNLSVNEMLDTYKKAIEQLIK